MVVPTSQRQWTLTGNGDVDKLTLGTAPIPELGDRDVLVNIRAISLNYRDQLVLGNAYPMPRLPTVVPVSDGAGAVVAIGSRVSRWAPGDHVMPAFHSTFLAGRMTKVDVAGARGGQIHGVAQEYVAVPEDQLVRVPAGWSDAEAATLPCAALTAWNALFGLVGRRLVPGDWVLVQGSGGVSTFALKFAKSAGARVVCTTSSAAKAERLKALGADHVINYRDVPEWGPAARALTPGGDGFAHVVDVGGPGTLGQSALAVRLEGVITVVGLVAPGDHGAMPTMMDALRYGCIVRGVMVGSVLQFREMVAGIEANDIKPVIDDRVFKFEELQDAYLYNKSAKHFGKIVVKVY